MTKRVANEFCSVPIRTNHDLSTVFVVFLGLSSFAVFLRILARIVTKVYYWWDDLFCFLAMVGRTAPLLVPKLTGTQGGCIALTVLELLGESNISHTKHTS